MARNLLAKAGRVQIPPAKAEVMTPAAGSGPLVPAKPKTAPGTLMGFMANQSETMKENELLREQVARFDGATPARLLDPQTVVASKWANRHVASFDTEEFAQLKDEISRAGGNVQPIKVRPLVPAVGDERVTATGAAGAARFEIVFGHRRHRACLELGLPVLAVVAEATEQELFVQMERENRNRVDLSAWEQGVMYTRALDQGLYPSNRQLATAIGRDVTDVGKAIALARLPHAVIEAFRSPLDLQFRWAKPLNDLQQSDPEGLLRRAKAVAMKQLSAKEVFAALCTDRGVGPSYPSADVTIERNGNRVATITTALNGQVIVRFHQKLDEAQRVKLSQLLETLVA